MAVPELPDGVEWPSQTKLWWQSLPSTPGSDNWTDSDWEQLKTIALVHAQVWGAGDFEKVGLLERLLADFGVTPAARKNLGEQSITVKQDKPVTVLDMITQRRLEKKRA